MSVMLPPAAIVPPCRHSSTADAALGSVSAWTWKTRQDWSLLRLAVGTPGAVWASVAAPALSLTVRLGGALPVVSRRWAVARRARPAFRKFGGRAQVRLWLKSAPAPVAALLASPLLRTARVRGTTPSAWVISPVVLSMVS